MATSAFGGVYILINNAAVFRPTELLEVDESEYNWFPDTILTGKFFVAQAAAFAMKQRGGGAIVQTGSLCALQSIGRLPRLPMLACTR